MCNDPKEDSFNVLARQGEVLGDMEKELDFLYIELVKAREKHGDVIKGDKEAVSLFLDEELLEVVEAGLCLTRAINDNPKAYFGDDLAIIYKELSHVSVVALRFMYRIRSSMERMRNVSQNWPVEQQRG